MLLPLLSRCHTQVQKNDNGVLYTKQNVILYHILGYKMIIHMHVKWLNSQLHRSDKKSDTLACTSALHVLVHVYVLEHIVSI